MGYGAYGVDSASPPVTAYSVKLRKPTS